MAHRKLAALAAALLAGVLVVGCSSTREGSTSTDGESVAAGGETLVGITMPTKSLERWNNDGSQLVTLLQEKGYKTQLDYADNKPEEQAKQLENQINAGAKILIVASIESKALIPTLQTAAEKGIKIIAYDRLLMDTENVDYYATFDLEKVGNLQGEFIVENLGLKDGKGPFNIELFAGSPDDNNASLYFKGAWDILKPYYDEGKLKVPSGKVPETLADWAQIGILSWKAETAQNEMENRLNSFYSDKKVDAVLSPNDSLALGIAQALEGKGYKVGDDWPILTGQDGDVANIKNILAGKQTMTVWKDTRKLADAVAAMVDDIAGGKEPGITTSYSNNTKDVPSVTLESQVVVEDTVQSLLVDSGFVTEDQLK
ncbi:MAG: sugar-binding protein [Propionibacteriaceae bacterium]|jgi:putative multiple sugar transport system substrate-binding protein|nr:sugar-binding protein [Propionibacteriaceae bacterium]